MQDFAGKEINIDLGQFKGLAPLAVGVLALVAVIVAVSTIVFTVPQDSVGVITRFGKYSRTMDPGLHAKLPFRIEKVEIAPVQAVQKQEFGFRTKLAGRVTVYDERSYPDEALMLCGDLNCAMVEWSVQYKIKNAKDYLFNVREKEDTIRNVSEAVMRAIIGDSSVDEVLTVRRIEINEEAQEQMQQLLDSYGVGIEIFSVKLQDVNPPETVKPAFNEVNEAKQDQEKFVNEAWQEYNREVPKARGEAQKIIQEAEAYAVERVNEARGDAHRFLAMWEEYKEAEDVTRRRLYLEAVKEVLPQIETKFVIDESQKGILQFLPLDTGGDKK
jgi:membrane protease subunit HflK